MVTFIIFLTLLNFALGFAIGVYLKRSPDVDLFIPEVGSLPLPQIRKDLQRVLVRVPWLGKKFAAAAEKPAVVSEHATEISTESAVAEIAVADIPATEIVGSGKSGFDDLLKDVGKHARTILDRSLLNAVEEAFKHKRRLLGIERQLQRRMLGDKASGLEQILLDLQQINLAWADKMLASSQALYDSLAAFGQWQELASQIDHAIFDLALQARDVGRAAQVTERDAEKTTGQYLLAAIARWVDGAHTFRDQASLWKVQLMPASIATNDVEADGAATGDADPHTGDTAPNKHAAASETEKAGPHFVWAKCRRSLNDAVANRSEDESLRFAMIDFDRVPQCNLRLGVRRVDVAMEAIRGHFATWLRHRLPHELTLLPGRRAIVTLRDFPPDEALRCIEQVRQCVEATTVRFEKQDSSLTVSCALLDAPTAITAEEVFERLCSAVEQTQAAGGNQTSVVSEEGKISLLPSRPIEVNATVIVAEDVWPSPLEAAPPSPSPSPPFQSRRFPQSTDLLAFQAAS